MMQRRQRAILALTAAPLGLGLLACSGGASSPKPTPTPTVATRPATIAVVTPSPTSTTVAVATPAPRATVAATPAPVATPVTAATTAPAPTVAATAAMAPRPVGSAVAAAARPATFDPALQQKLDGAALTETDLPAGFSAQSGINLSHGRQDDAADLTRTFVKLPRGGGGTQSMLLSMVGFADQSASAAAFDDTAQQAVSRAAATGATATLVNGGPHLGDATQIYHMTASRGSVSTDGYLIVWRRGRVGVVVSLVGMPGAAPQLDDVAALAALQDGRLKAAGI